MAYGKGSRAFIEDEPVHETGKAASIRPGAHSWQKLSEACRLALVERSLGAANDLSDGFPAAL